MCVLIRNEVLAFQVFCCVRQYCNIALNYEAKTICGLKERWKHSKKEAVKVVVEVGCKSASDAASKENPFSKWVGGYLCSFAFL
jgi:hypothetical protein